MNLNPVLWEFLGGIAFLVLAVFASDWQARKGRSEAAESMSKAAAELIDPYRKEVAALRVQVADLEKWKTGAECDIANLKRENEAGKLERDKLTKVLDEVIAGAHLLKNQVVEAKLTPVYIPPERRNLDGEQ